MKFSCVVFIDLHRSSGVDIMRSCGLQRGVYFIFLCLFHWMGLFEFLGTICECVFQFGSLGYDYLVEIRKTKCGSNGYIFGSTTIYSVTPR